MKLQTEDRRVLWALTFTIVLVAVCILVAFDKLKWADPVGTAVVLLAAFIGGWFIIRQTKASGRLDIMHRGAKFLAARAAMPLTLANVNVYARTCAEILGKLYKKRSGHSLNRISELRPFPNFPIDAVTEFRMLIEYGPPEIGECIATLLAHIQVQRARLEDVERWNNDIDFLLVTIPIIEDYIIDAAETYERGNALYDYARFRADKPREITASRIVDVLEFQFKFYRAVGSTLHERAAQWTPDFNAKFPTIEE